MICLFKRMMDVLGSSKIMDDAEEKTKSMGVLMVKPMDGPDYADLSIKDVIFLVELTKTVTWCTESRTLCPDAYLFNFRCHSCIVKTVYMHSLDEDQARM